MEILATFLYIAYVYNEIFTSLNAAWDGWTLIFLPLGALGCSGNLVNITAADALAPCGSRLWAASSRLLLILTVWAPGFSGKRGQYHGCRCPGSLWSQVISSHGIDMCMIGRYLSSGRKDFNYLHRIEIEESYKWLTPCDLSLKQFTMLKVNCANSTHRYSRTFFMSCIWSVIIRYYIGSYNDNRIQIKF